MVRPGAKTGGSMKRIISVVVILLLVTVYCYAQSARNPAYDSNVLTGTSNLTNIGVTGLDVTNNPGYIVMKGVGSSASDTSHTDTDANTTWILWIDEENDLCMSSYVTISAFSSFPSGSWDDDNMPAVCTKVGGQT